MPPGERRPGQIDRPEPQSDHHTEGVLPLNDITGRWVHRGYVNIHWLQPPYSAAIAAANLYRKHFGCSKQL